MRAPTQATRKMGTREKLATVYKPDPEDECAEELKGPSEKDPVLSRLMVRIFVLVVGRRH